jgi:hypothetical protein
MDKKKIRQRALNLIHSGNCVIRESQGRHVICLREKKNQLLKAALKECGCFSFFDTNSGEKIIGLSQVIYFLTKGWKALENGYVVRKDEDEIHHIDGDPLNNHSDNLVCLSIEDHHIVTAAQSGNCLERTIVWDREGPTRFNNRGETIANPIAFLRMVVAKTVFSTFRAVVGAAKRFFPIAEIVEWVQSVLVGCWSRQDMMERLNIVHVNKDMKEYI